VILLSLNNKDQMKNNNQSSLKDISDKICFLLSENHKLILSTKKLIHTQDYSEIIKQQNRINENTQFIRELQSKANLHYNEDTTIIEKQISSLKILTKDSNQTKFRYAGEIPSSTDDETLFLKLNELAEFDVTRIINLTEEGETNFKGIPLRDYNAQLQNIRTKNGDKIQMERFSIPDLDIPSIDKMNEILNAIIGHINSGHKVYVHCWGGIGRTGTVIGCFLIENGILKNKNAIPYIDFLKRNTEIHDRNSPETEEQCNFINSWGKY
jgi:protein tyrosine/serine phosphatase